MKKDKGKLLTSNNNPKKSKKGSILTNKRNRDSLFKLSIEEPLDNDFEFKNLKQNDIQEFHKFIEKTVNQKLTVTEVDNKFLRKRGGTKRNCIVNGEKRDVYHYGLHDKPFRIFGYYRNQYFVIWKIDPKHKTDKC